MSRPASSGSSLSTSCSSAEPPPNSEVNSRWKCPFTTCERGQQPLARLAVEALDALAQPLDRFGQIVALGDQAGVLRLDLVQLFLGAQVDGAEPLAVAAQLVEPFLDRRRRRAARRPARSRPAPRPARARSRASRGSRARCRRCAVRRPRAAPRRAPARCAPRPSLRARRARPCRPRRARSRRRRGGRRLRAARLRPARPRRSARGAARRTPRARLRARCARSARRRARCSSAAIWLAAPLWRPSHSARSAAIAARRLARNSASRASACASPRASASTARLAATSPRDSASWFSSSAADAERLDRLRGVALGGERLVAARREPHLGFGERREPRGQPVRLALGGGMRIARRVGLRLRLAPRIARFASRPRPPRRGRLRPLRRRGACPRRRWRAWPSSASRSARRFFAARRRAAAVGAFEAAAKPSQRHRSPSGETSRWPGLQLRNQRRPERAIDHADLRQPARQLGRRRDMARERLGAVRQSGIARIRRRAGPADRRGRIDRRFEIVAERRAERGLETLFHREQVDRRRPQLLGLDIDQLGERLRLPPRAGRRAARPRRAGRARHRAPAAPPNAPLRRAARRLRPPRRRPARPRRRSRAPQRRARRSPACPGSRARSRLRRSGLPAASAAPSDRPSRVRAGCAAPPDRRARWSARRTSSRPRQARSRRAATRAATSASRSATPAESCVRPASSAASRSSAACASARKPLLALDILGELEQTPVEFGDALVDARFLAVERLARHHEALQRGAGLGLFVAQRRQIGGRDCA